MADDDNRTMEEIGAALKTRLPVERSLTERLTVLMRELDDAEKRYRIDGVLGRRNHLDV